MSPSQTYVLNPRGEGSHITVRAHVVHVRAGAFHMRRPDIRWGVQAAGSRCAIMAPVGSYSPEDA